MRAIEVDAHLVGLLSLDDFVTPPGWHRHNFLEVARGSASAVSAPSARTSSRGWAFSLWEERTLVYETA